MRFPQKSLYASAAALLVLGSAMLLLRGVRPPPVGVDAPDVADLPDPIPPATQNDAETFVAPAAELNVPTSRTPDGNTGLSVRGRVVEAIGWKAVPEARVSCGDIVTVTDAGGEFSLAGLSAGVSKIEARANELGGEAAIVELKAGPTPYLIIEVTPTWTLRGKVIDRQGVGISGVTIRTVGESVRSETISGKRGAFALEGLSRDSESIRLLATHRGRFRGRYGAPGWSTAPSTPVELRLDAGFTVDGVVLTEAGSPIVGAAVYVRWPEEIPPTGHDFGELAKTEPPEPLAHSNAAGTFELQNMVSHTMVTVHHAEYAPSRSIVPSTPNETSRQPAHTYLSFRLERGVGVSGYVVDSRDRPVDEATVVLHPRVVIAGPRPNRQTDSAGEFRFDHLPPTLGNFSVAKDGHLTEWHRPRRIDKPMRIRLRERGRILGTVVDDTSGEPVRNFRILFARGSGTPNDAPLLPERLRRTGLTFGSREGDFSVAEGLAADVNYDVTVIARGFVTRTFESCRAGHAAADADAETNTFRVSKGHTVSGIVVNADDAPIEGVRVDVGEPDDVSAFWQERATLRTRGGLQTTSTDAHGRFELSGAENDITYVSLEKIGYARAHFRVQSSEGVAESELPRLTLHRGASLRGRVVHKDGRPVADCSILTSVEGIRLTARTDTAGRFRIRALPAGLAVVTVLREPMQLAQAAAELTAGMETTLTVELPAGGLAGVVLLGGEPLEGASVKVEQLLDGRPDIPWSPAMPQRTLVTNAEGRFRLGALGVGSYRLHASYTPSKGKQRRSLDQTVALQPDEWAQVELLFPEGTISGGVQDAEGVLIAGAFVELRREEGDRLQYVEHRNMESHEALFEFRDLRPGRYRLFAAEREGEQIAGTAGPVVLSSATSMKRVVIELNAPGLLDVSVRSDSGQPIEGATVRVMTSLGEAYGMQATTKKNGVATLREVPRGDVRLTVASPGHMEVERAISVESLETAIAVELTPASWLVVELVGDPSPASYKVRATTPKTYGSPGWTWTAKDGGALEVERTQRGASPPTARFKTNPGRYRVTFEVRRATGPPGKYETVLTEERDVWVPAGEATNVTLSLP